MRSTVVEGGTVELLVTVVEVDGVDSRSTLMQPVRIVALAARTKARAVLRMVEGFITGSFYPKFG
ncbi:MAG: hypothetical protein BGO12_11720 [Verrucomicrobia bacterium 61-8]|nr:MAG: hypothetical protein BGO12_11720 [Verrucomicrobia bacterium 61-8]